MKEAPAVIVPEVHDEDHYDTQVILDHARAERAEYLHAGVVHLGHDLHVGLRWVRRVVSRLTHHNENHHQAA